MRKARKYALDILYSADLTRAGLAETMQTYVTMSDHGIPDYSRQLAQGVVDNRELIDGYLSASLVQGWSVERMPAIDRCLARIAVYEMAYVDVAAPIAISEAIALASELSTDASPTFLSGVLGHVAVLLGRNQAGEDDQGAGDHQDAPVMEAADGATQPPNAAGESQPKVTPSLAELDKAIERASGVESTESDQSMAPESHPATAGVDPSTSDESATVADDPLLPPAALTDSDWEDDDDLADFRPDWAESPAKRG